MADATHRKSDPLEEDMDLTPPEERRARILRRRFLIGGIILAILIAVAWYGAAPTGNAIKAWQSRRLARNAFASIEKEDWKAAADKARDAYQLSPAEPEAWRAVARYLSRSGQESSALEWWAKLAQAGSLSLDDRREYAGAALGAGDLITAAGQIDQLFAVEGESPAPRTALLKAQLSVRRTDGVTALKYAEQTLSDLRATPREVLSAGLLIVGFTVPESAPNKRAWSKIEELARDPENPLSLDALALVAQYRSSPSPPSEETAPFSTLTAPSPAATGMSLEEVATALEKHPRARPFHKLLALQLRARIQPLRADEYVNEAIERFGGGDEESFKTLVTWLNSSGRSDAVLHLLPLDRASQQRDLFLQYVEALGTQARWEDMKELLSSDRFPIQPMLQHMYLAAARAKLGENAGATNEWQRALDLADSPEKLFALGNYAERYDAIAIADSAYARALQSAPKMRPAYAARLRLTEQRAQTAEAQKIAAEIVRVWPDDSAAQEEDAYLRLLLGASPAEVETAEREAQTFVAQNPADWNARKLLGLARLRLGKTAAALQAFSGVRATGAEPPGALAVRAAALDANGWKDGARNDARNLAAANLLPEERALLAPIIAATER